MVSTLGFEEKWAVRAILTYGLEPGDKIVLFTGSVIDRVKKAYESIVKIASMVGSVDVKLYEINTSCSFIEFVSKIKSVVESEGRRASQIIVVLSGGMRAIVLAVYTALLFLGKEVKEKIKVVRIDLEDERCYVEVPPILLREHVETWDPGVLKELIKIIHSRSVMSLNNLSRETGKDPTTLRRQLQKLASKGVVVVEQRPYRARATELAKLYV